MASAISALTSSNSSGAASSSSAAAGTSGTGDQQVFLQLLVSQLKNQDPLNPTDSTQFVSELAQFSELEQVIGIRSDIESYHTQAVQAAATADNSSTTPGQTSSTGTPSTTGDTQP
jgi:flagellar basal-body rod modification protein FlgD